eukprot:NODE_2618_length_461_cov_198.189349_g2600_i0.p2 GENE.NODE_2618_length_461_cov_198.189349_g2600_i0~~NODE_2618_length_461_cov_198.189349_g2600_i0.p2  ORF type:complete len:121 (+),score=10.22 NODE_2618_length_461_cov_198.189349_g2600_i0:38-400(+)
MGDVARKILTKPPSPQPGDTWDVVIQYLHNLGLSKYTTAVTLDGDAFVAMGQEDWVKLGLTESDATYVMEQYTNADAPDLAKQVTSAAALRKGFGVCLSVDADHVLTRLPPPRPPHNIET